MAPYGWQSARAYFECTNLSKAALQLYKLTYPEQDCMNLPISKTSLYGLTYPKHNERTQSGRVVAMPLPETPISEIFYIHRCICRTTLSKLRI